jgi:predicted phosphodiesterase
MSSSLDKVLILPDTHAPYHDERAWKLVMKVARRIKPDTIIHLGDLADFYKVSNHSKDPARTLSFKDELKGVHALRAELDRLGAKRKIFIEGNHEERFRRYLADKAPELFGIVTTDELLKLTENDWEFVPYRSAAKVGRVYFTHDTGGGGKYSTAHALDSYQHSVVIGHHHSIQYYVAGDAVGKYRVGAQFGWLGDIKKVDYMHQVKVRRLWALGFGTGVHDRETGVVFLTPHPIVNYQTCVNGKILRG